MPKGILLIGWTNKEGFFLIYKYPEDLKITEEEVMRIGSLHRMRNLNANTIYLKLKDLNVVSFFSGLITANYYIAPNFVISLLLDKYEDKKNYMKTLPLGAKIVLKEFPLEKFDARTTTEKEVLSKIGTSYKQTLPQLFQKLVNNEIAINEDELNVIFASKTELDKLKEENEKLKEELVNKDVTINLLKETIEELTQKLKSSESMLHIKVELEKKLERQRIENKLTSKIKSLEAELEKSKKMINELQETVTLLLDYKLVMQQRDEENKIFLKSLLDSLEPHYDDDFHQEMIKKLIEHLEKIEWTPEI
ncbi:MAG: hypothetical protein ACTSRP_13705 [Candidatus Helarchaeota archaeon]